MKQLMKLFTGMAFVLCGSLAIAQPADVAMPRKGLCAHRGGLDTHPENTIPAFRNALAAGVQMMEFDIQFSKDSVLVIMHDDSVDRTTNGTGKVEDLTLAQLKQLDAGIRKDPQFSGTRVPTLEETLAMMPRNIWLNCHLKGGAVLGRKVAAMVASAGRLHQCLLACSEEAAAGARQVVPGIIICNADNKYRQDNQEYADATIREKATFIQLLSAAGNDEGRKPVIRQLRENGVSINYFFSAKAEEAATLWNSGINYILVNNLPAFVPEMKKAGIEPVQYKF